jgi:predicted secreted Zn-dependent protease
VWSYVGEEEFRRHAALMRLTEPQIEAALASVRIHDDCYFRRPRALEVTPERVRGWDEGH